MRLSNCNSIDLAPVNDAERIAWACAAFDEFVRVSDARRHALSAPFSRDAIKALTDAEMQRYYAEIGLAPYYADLPRQSREDMLYAELANLRKLGTKAAVEALCQYIFGANPIALTIVDNLAFDANGTLTNASLLNLYDCIITSVNPVLDKFQLSRIFNNITRFGRVSQQLRGIVMRYETGDFQAYWGVTGLDTVAFYDNNWINCEVPVIPNSIVIGLDTALPSSATRLSLTNLYCMSNFGGGSSYNNLWNPSEYSDNLLPTNPNPSDETIPNSYYANVWLWNGTGTTEMLGNGSTFRLGTYQEKPEIYTNINTQCDGMQSACVIELAAGNLVFGGTSEFSIPSGLYTRTGDTLEWNPGHPLYHLLYGRTANVTY